MHWFRNIESLVLGGRSLDSLFRQWGSRPRRSRYRIRDFAFLVRACLREGQGCIDQDGLASLAFLFGFECSIMRALSCFGGER